MRPYKEQRAVVDGQSDQKKGKILLNFGTTTLSITTLSIMTSSIMTISMGTLGIMTLSKTSFNTVVLCVFYTDSLLYRGSHKPIMLSVVMLSVVMPNAIMPESKHSSLLLYLDQLDDFETQPLGQWFLNFKRKFWSKCICSLCKPDQLKFSR